MADPAAFEIKVNDISASTSLIIISVEDIVLTESEWESNHGYYRLGYVKLSPILLAEWFVKSWDDFFMREHTFDFEAYCAHDVLEKLNEAKQSESTINFRDYFITTHFPKASFKPENLSNLGFPNLGFLRLEDQIIVSCYEPPDNSFTLKRHFFRVPCGEFQDGVYSFISKIYHYLVKHYTGKQSMTMQRRIRELDKWLTTNINPVYKIT